MTDRSVAARLIVGGTAGCVVAAALAVAATPIVAAGLRHSLHLPLGLCVALAAALTAGAALYVVGAWLRAGASWAAWVAVGAFALLLRLVDVALIAPTAGELVTVGGGDLGHHLHIAALLAGPMPTVYVGFTGWHATMVSAAWAIDAGWWVPAYAVDGSDGSWSPPTMLDAAAAAVVVGWAAFALAAALLVTALASSPSPREARTSAQADAGATGQHRVGGRQRGVATVVGWAVAMALTMAAFQGFLLAAMHYHVADGFVAHAHAAALTLVGAWAALVTRGRKRRLAALLVVVGLLRFDYGLNLPETALAWATLALATAGVEPTRRWRNVLLVAGVGVALAAIAMAFALSGSWAKVGGMMHPTLTARIEVLSLALIAVVAAWRLARRPFATWLMWLLGVPLAVALAHAAFPQLPRAYYLFKHGVHAELLLVVALAGLAGAGVRQIIAGVATRRDGLLTVAVVVAAWAAPGALADANGPMMRGFRERGQPTWAWRQLAPLHTPMLTKVLGQLQRDGHRVDAALHPHWPVASALASMQAGWTGLEVAPVRGLQPRHW